MPYACNKMQLCLTHYSTGMQPYLQASRMSRSAWDVCVCVDVKMHRPLYVWGVKHYVGIEVERHGNVRKVLMVSFLSWLL